MHESKESNDAGTPSNDAGTPSNDAGTPFDDAGTPGFLPDHVSGSRLRASYVTANGGLRTFTGWYDTQLDTLCQFETAADGVTRCLPSTQLSVQGDPACTEPYALGDPGTCTSTAKYAWGNTASGLDTYELGAQITLKGYASAQQDCVFTPYPDGSVGYALGRKLAPAELVGTQVVHVPSGHRLDPIVRQADDGSSERIGWYDTKLSARCEVDVAADGKQRCLTFGKASITTLFSDNHCQTPLAESFNTSFDDSAFAVETSGMCETYRIHVFSLGAEYAGPFFSETNSCIPSAPNFTETVYVRGAEIEPSTFDEFTPTLLGNGRVQARATRDADGAVDLPNERLYDSATGGDCTWLPATDGITRCVPPYMNRIFTSMSCDDSTALGATSTRLCNGPLEAYVAWRQGDACSGAYALAAAGASAPTPSTYFYQPGGVCDPLSSSNDLFFQVGASVDISKFELGTYAVEPQ